MDHTQIPIYVSRFEPLLYFLAFTQKDIHYVHTRPSTKGPPLSNYNSTLGVHSSSLKHNHPYTRGIGTKPNHNHLYIRGIRHKAKTQTQLPLHKRVGHKPNHNHLYTRGTRHKAKTQPQSPLHKGDRHKIKVKKRLQSW